MAERREILPGVEEYGALVRREAEPAIMVPPPDTVRLATGEYVPESEFRKLSGTEQSLLMRSGVDAFNREQERIHKQKVKAYEAEKARYEKTTIEVGPGKDPVLRSEFHKLTSKQQNLLSRVGVEEFNKRQAAEAAKAKLEAAKVRATLVELSTGEYVSKAEFRKLTPKYQAELRKLGTVAFNKKYAPKPYEAWHVVGVPPTKDAILLKTGEYVPEKEFKELTSVQQAYLKKHGITAFNVEQEKIHARQVKAYVEARGGVVGVVSEAEAAKLEAAYRKAKKVKIVPPEAITPRETVSEAYNRLLKEGEIPLVSKLITTQAEFEKTGVIEYERPAGPPTTTAGVTVPEKTASLLSMVWQALTPWEEEKDDTFWDYVKGTPKRFISPDIPTQEELAATYEAEQTAPLWSRILFGMTVTKNPKTGEYLPILMAEYPTGKKAGIVQAARVLTKTVEVNWNKLISPQVVKPQVNWSKVAESIRLGEVRSAYDAARWAAAQAKWFPKTRLTPGSPEYQKWMGELTQKGLRAAADAAARVRLLDSLDKMRLVLVPGPGPSVGWKEFRPSELTATKMKELVAQWEGMKPSDAVQQINRANLVTAVAAYQPEALSRFLSKVAPSQKADTMSRLQPAIQEAIKVDNLTKVRELAKIQLKVSTQLAPATATVLAVATQTAVETMTKALAKGKAMTEVQTETIAAVEAAVQTAVQAIIQTATATELQTATEIATQIEAVTQAITQTAIQTATQTLTGYVPVELTGKPPTVPKKPPKVPKVPKVPIPKLPEVKGIVVRKTYPDGTVVWKQGMFWKIIPPPYSAKQPISSRTPPEGVTVLEGTPQETLTFIGGVVPPRNMSFDLGVTDGFIDIEARTITFTGYGEETVVGLRMPSPTKGLTLRHVKPVRKYKKPRARSRPQVSRIRS